MSICPSRPAIPFAFATIALSGSVDAERLRRGRERLALLGGQAQTLGTGRRRSRRCGPRRAALGRGAGTSGQQQQGRSLLWDKEVDADVWQDYRAGKVAQKAYVYYSYTPAGKRTTPI